MTTSSSSPSLLNDGAKNFSHSTHGKLLCGALFNTHPLSVHCVIAQAFTYFALPQIPWTPQHPHCSVILVLLAFPKGERWVHKRPTLDTLVTVLLNLQKSVFWVRVDFFFVTLYVFLCATRPLTRQQVNSSLRELRAWPPCLSLLSRPSPHLSSHILALVAPQLQHWHQVSIFETLHWLRNHPVLDVTFYMAGFCFPSFLFEIV